MYKEKIKKFNTLFLCLILLIILLCSAFPFTAYAAEKTEAEQLERKLAELRFKADEFLNNLGYLKPYTDSTFERLQNGIDYADEVLCGGSESTIAQYQDAIETLEYAINNPTIDTYFAKETYVLSLKEHNENGFYNENDWNDFSEKRNALRDSFKTKNEVIVSDAFVSLHSSFVNMTSKYTLAGDITNDGKVNIDDATLIQKYLAGMNELTEMQKTLAAAYGNTVYEWFENPNPDIDCVTGIQMCTAGLVDMNTNPVHYGLEINDGLFTYNTNISLIVMDDERYDAVDAKVSELEADGII